MAFRVTPRAEADLDDIWLYVAKECGSTEIANRLIDTLTDRFFTLVQFPYIGRSREDDFARPPQPGSVIVYNVENEDALILRGRARSSPA